MNDNIPEDDLYGEDAPTQRVGNEPGVKAPASKLENVAALGKNPKTSRVILATVGAVVLVGGIAVIGIVSKNRRGPEPTPAALSGAAVGDAPTGLADDSSAALANSQQYKDIVAASEQQRSKEALANGQSAQPLAATVEGALKAAPTPAEQATSAAETERLRLQAEAAERASNVALQQQQAQQASGGANQQQQDQVYQQMVTNAQNAMAQLMSSRARGTAVYTMVDQGQGGSSGGLQQTAYQQGGGQAGTAGAQAAPASVMPPTQYTLVGAGEILSARIDTGVNTDIGGDFGATLLTGKYAGAKLIGSVQRKGETAQMSVRLMSLPAQGVSVPAAAVILDAETAEGGTATDVDRKLFIKYGVKPVAAGFAAVADYLKNSGTTVVVNGEAVTTSQPELTNKRAAQIIGGSAAQQVNTDANALDTTPTVRVRRGSIVGVFFTQDVLYTPKK